MLLIIQTKMVSYTTMYVYWEIVAKFYKEFTMTDQQDNKVV